MLRKYRVQERKRNLRLLSSEQKRCEQKRCAFTKLARTYLDLLEYLNLNPASALGMRSGLATERTIGKKGRNVTAYARRNGVDLGRALLRAGSRRRREPERTADDHLPELMGVKAARERSALGVSFLGLSGVPPSSRSASPLSSGTIKVRSCSRRRRIGGRGRMEPARVLGGERGDRGRTGGGNEINTRTTRRRRQRWTVIGK